MDSCAGVDMVDENKIKAVIDYLREEFPHCKIEDWPVVENQAHHFRIIDEKSAFRAEVSEEFLSRHDKSAIPDKLRKFTLAEHLRELPSDVVLVTSTGLKLDYE